MSSASLRARLARCLPILFAAFSMTALVAGPALADSHFPDDPDDRSDTITLVIVFSAAAIEALPQYGTFSLQYNIGGVVFTHNIMHMD